MAGIGNVWTNAIRELRDAEQRGPEHARVMESGIRWGLFFGWLIQLFYVGMEILTDKTVRGFNTMFVLVFICQSIITYTFTATVLLLAKLIKFGLRAGATAGVRGFFVTIGEETCQVIIIESCFKSH